MGAAIGCALVYYYAQDLPDYSQLEHYHPPAVTRIYSGDGKLMEEYAKEHRVFVPISTIPPSLLEAFIAAEDKNFYQHPGIDAMGVVRAVFSNVLKVMQGKRMEGASTITQQVVRNFLLTSERSIARKVKEAILSYMISKVYSKDKILELYLNQIFLGHGAYGVAAAAQMYFNKSVEELSIAEAAYLAALPKAPSNFNPAKNYERAKGRRDYVILRMVEDGYISSQAAREAIDTPLVLTKRSKQETVTAGYYAEKVRDEIIKKFGSEFFYNGGLTVITSLNSRYQEQAEKSLRRGIRDYDMQRGFRGAIAKMKLDNWQEDLKALPEPPGLLEYQLAVILEATDSNAKIGLKDGSQGSIPLAEMKWGATNLKSPKTMLNKGDVVAVEPAGKGYGLRQIPVINGAIMVMQPRSGQVLAMVGGYDFKTSKFDRATQAKRQPGSLIKPFVYVAGLERGLSPETMLEDKQVEVYQGAGLPIWRPRNFDRTKFLGPMTMREGLARSLNSITVGVTQRVGLSSVAEIIKRFGINESPRMFYSMILGALETTLDKMTSAFAVMANGGFKVEPQFIELIKDSNGKVIYRRDAGVCNTCTVSDATRAELPEVSYLEHVRILDVSIAYQINSMMQSNVSLPFATGRKAQALGKIVGGKTGSTNDSKDVWFEGFTPDVVVGTYIGYDNPKALRKNDTGGTVALPIFVDFMAKAMADVPSKPFYFPEGSKTLRIQEAPDEKMDEAIPLDPDDVFSNALKTNPELLEKQGRGGGGSSDEIY